MTEVPRASPDQIRLISASIEIGVKLATANFGARAVGQVDHVAVVTGDLAAVVVVLVRVEWNAGLCFAVADVGLALVADLGEVVGGVAGWTECLVLDVVDVQVGIGGRCQECENGYGAHVGGEVVWV